MNPTPRASGSKLSGFGIGVVPEFFPSSSRVSFVFSGPRGQTAEQLPAPRSFNRVCDLFGRDMD